MVRDVFRLAREHSPAIVFIDEIDSIATKRFDAQTGADREVRQTQLDLYGRCFWTERVLCPLLIIASSKYESDIIMGLLTKVIFMYS